MSNIGSVLYTAKQAILSNLTAINVTGSNISNVNTPGYSRLVPVFESVGTKDPTSSQEQIGVQISDIRRIYDSFLEYQIVSQGSSVGSATARNDLLSQIEGVLNESTGNGINDALSQFWNAWENLSVNPSGEAERTVLISAAENLTSVFNQRAEELISIQDNVNQMIANDIDKLNGYLKDMAAMNAEIVSVESSGGESSALNDGRAELLGKISSMIDINYVERADGSLYIYLPANGKSLVEGDNSWQLQVQRNATNSNLYDIVLADDANNPINEDIGSGELGGLLNIRDVVLVGYIDEINQTASSIINKTNAQHRAGYDQDGNIGTDFFTEAAQAKDMKINTAIVDDMRKIAASSTLNADGNNATAIAALKDDNMYASLSVISSVTAGTGEASAILNNIGQAYKNTTSAITLTRGATSAAWTVTSNGGYTSLNVLSSDDNLVTLDLNGNGTADMALSLSGSWTSGDTLSFSLRKQDNTTTVGGYYSAFMAKVGQDVASSATILEREEAIAAQKNTQRETLSGVSLDEEMLNLIKYQMAYNAASRVTSIVSEMMDTLITLGR